MILKNSDVPIFEGRQSWVIPQQASLTTLDLLPPPHPESELVHIAITVKT